MPRPSQFLLASIAALLLLRLSGYSPAWLPGAGAFAALLFAGHLVVLADRLPDGPWWRQLARARVFELGLAAVTLLAIAIRLAGLGGDLRHQPLDIDENRLAANVKHYFVTGELLHETVEHYPGLVFWLFSGSAFVSYLRVLTRGLAWLPAQMPVESFIYAARMANVFVGAGIAVLTGLVARRVTGIAASLLAACLVAIVPLSVDLTQARNDPGMMLSVVAAVAVALAHAAGARTFLAISGGALAGIAAGIKYSGAFAIVPVVIATLTVGSGRDRLRHTAGAIAAFFVAIAVTNHFVWLDFPTFLRQLADQVAITARYHWAATDNPAAFYVSMLTRFGVGAAMLALAAAFFVYALTTRDRVLWIVVSFPLVYLWFMAGRPSQFPRWVFPLLPFVAIAGSAALAAIVGTARTWSHNKATVVRVAALGAAAVVACGVVWQPLSNGVLLFSRRAKTPTHTLAERWIDAHVTAGARMLLGEGWLVVSSRYAITRVPALRPILDGGMDRLAAYDWIVVPEPEIGHPLLQQLALVQRIHAAQGFGGRLGYDFEIYSIPKFPGSGPIADPARRSP